MADRVNQYNQTPNYQSYLGGDSGAIDDPNNPNNVNNGPLSGIDPLHLHTYDGNNPKTNKFSKGTRGQSEGGDEDTQDALQIFQNAGIPGMSVQQINAAQSRVDSDPQLKAGVQQMSSSINQMSDPNAVQGSATNLFNAGEQLAKSKNIDIWQLLVVALKGSARDQNEQLRYDLTRLQVLSKVSAQMSTYSQVLQDAQQRIDDKMGSEKDDKKKQNVEVKLNDQRNYEASDLDHLMGDGTVKYTQTADQNPDHMQDGTQANPNYDPSDPRTTDKHNPRNIKADTTHNMVSATGLNVKIQTFTQERDQLQKNIDKGTQKYQSDNEAKNQVFAAITAVLKNFYDMLSNTTRNTSM